MLTSLDNTWPTENAAARPLRIIAQSVCLQEQPAAVDKELDLGMIDLHAVQAPPISQDLSQGLAA